MAGQGNEKGDAGDNLHCLQEAVSAGMLWLDCTGSHERGGPYGGEV